MRFMLYLYHLREIAAMIVMKDCRYGRALWSTVDVPLKENGELKSANHQLRTQHKIQEISMTPTLTASRGQSRLKTRPDCEFSRIAEKAYYTVLLYDASQDNNCLHPRFDPPFSQFIGIKLGSSFSMAHLGKYCSFLDAKELVTKSTAVLGELPSLRI